MPKIKVANVNDIVDIVYSNFYKHPQKKLKIFAVTGTDGKTSTSTIVQTLIGKDKCANIGTNGANGGGISISIDNTTPDSDKFYGYLKEFLEASCTAVSMEMSSEAMHYNRLKNLKFDVLSYTNITSEHLNTHKTLENYVDAKVAIFTTHLKADGIAILNADDPYAFEIKQRILQTEQLKNVQIRTYGTSQLCDLIILLHETKGNTTEIVYNYHGRIFKVISPLLGDFNVYNLACGFLMALSGGYDLDDLLKNVDQLKIPGRLEMIDEGQDFRVMVDYAHTPNGITELLRFVKKMPNVKRRITVIGQAGERDAIKRPIVGKIVAKNSSWAIFTYEDPRSEDVKNIINDMTRKIRQIKHNWEAVLDRKEAIHKAIFMAKPGDLVMILGKGAEDYQKISTGKIHFSDIEEAKEALKLRLSKN